MDTVEKILIVGGVLNLAYAFLIGFIMAGLRLKAPTVSKYLTLAHMGPLMQGPMLLALVVAFRFATMSEAAATWSATLLVVGSAILAAKDTVNWLQNIKDEFAEKPVLGSALGAMSTASSTIGLIMIIVGVLRAL